MEKNQIDEFFEKLPVEDKEQADIFETPKEVAKPIEDVPKPEDTDPEEAPESLKNRQHRRLNERLQRERETNIALNARLQALSEMDKFSKETSDIVIPDIAKMFDGSDIGKENALRLSKVILDTQQKAKEEAIREIELKREQEVQEQAKYEQHIDSELESLEDQFNVDLTSDAPKARKARREFLELVQNLSPKDEQGNIIGYADFESTFGMYQKTLNEEKPDTTRRQEIASRSMKRSNSSTEIVQQRSAGFDGWKRDIEKGII